MRCAEVLKNLKGIAEGGAVDNRAIEELISLGLVMRAPLSVEDTKLAELKSQLTHIKNQLRALKGEKQDYQYYSQGKASMDIDKRIEILTSQEMQIRNQILTLVQENAKGMVGKGALNTGRDSIALTYKGKEALQIIEARMPEVSEMDWLELFNKLEKFRSILASEAREASEILKLISQKLSIIEEYHLRSASVGLASIEGSPSEKAAKFLSYVNEFKAGAYFGYNFAALAAEAAVANEVQFKENPQNIVNDAMMLLSELLKNRTGPGPDTQYKALAILLMSKPIKDRPDLFNKILDDAPTTGNILASGLMLFDSPSDKLLADRKTRFQDWLGRLPPRSNTDNTDSVIAAALLSTASNPDVVTEKFNRAEACMRDLFEENMFTAAATIALWPASVSETLDNLRLASAEILNNKLSVGGLENFSLGMKLLAPNADFITLEHAVFERSHSAYNTMPISSSTLNPAMVATGIAAAGLAAVSIALLASPLLTRMPFMVFHAVTLQEYAVQDFRYHPVHSHYLYG
ncbi:MAG: hypothetical protein QXT63_04050 [Thermoplasmata archaeon]